MKKDKRNKAGKKKQPNKVQRIWQKEVLNEGKNDKKG
jgi:hypothetical protein